MKRISFLLIGFILMTQNSFAQTACIITPTSCNLIQNPGFEILLPGAVTVPPAPPNPNPFSFPPPLGLVPSWRCAYGSPQVSGSGITGAASARMWANGTNVEGIYQNLTTCIEANRVYWFSVQYMHFSPPPLDNSLLDFFNVYLSQSGTSGLTGMPGAIPMPPGFLPAPSQMIFSQANIPDANVAINGGACFTADRTYDQIVLYPQDAGVQRWLILDQIFLARLAYAGEDVNACCATIGPDCVIPGATYAWVSVPFDPSLDPTIPNPVVCPTVPTQYTLTVTSPDGLCMDTDIVQVNAYTPNFSVPGTICATAGSFSMLTGPIPAGVTVTYSGDLGGVDIVNHTFNPLTATSGINTFTVCFSFMGGPPCCTTYTIDVLPRPAIISTLNLNVCEDDPTIFIALQTAAMMFVNPAFFSPSWPLLGISDAFFTAFPTITPGLSVPAGPGLGLVTFNPDPANVGTNFITYNVVDANGCSNSVTGTITVSALPTVTLDPIPSIEICDYSGNPVQLTGTSNGINCIFSGPGIVDPILGLFDPVVAGAGTHTITYTCENGPCTNSATQTVTVTETESWHQTTKDAANRDNTKDVITDDDGNVYVTGYYTRQTTLHGGIFGGDVTIASGGATFGLTSYIAKYNSCGNLLWEAHAIDFLNNYGNSIVLDQPNNRVYITGDFEGRIRFTTSNICGAAPANLTAIGSGSKGYVATFDMTTGCIEFLEAITDFPYVRCEAIAIHETTGNIYVGGAHSTVPAGTVQGSFINKYTAGATLGGVIATVNSNTVTGGNNKVYDMDFNETTNTLWAIGNYIKNVNFIPGGMITSATPASISDAFLLSYTDGGAFFTSTLTRRGNNFTYMTGEGIAVDASTNAVYVTGAYRTQAIGGLPAFQTPGLLLPLGTAAQNKAYMIKIFGPGALWSRAGFVIGNQANGKAVSARAGIAYFTGTYMRSTLQFSAGYAPLAYTVVGPSGFLNHTYTAAYRTNGTTPFSSANATADLSNTADHSVESIYAGVNDRGFIVGMYSGSLRVGNFVGTTTPDLTSTGVAGHTNGFLIRVNSDFNGAYRTEEEETENAIAIETNEVAGLSVFPNPTNGLTTIAIENFDATNTNYTLVLYNSVGKLMQQINVTGNKTDVDLSAYENGIYLLSFSDGVTTSVVRISKTN